MAQVTEYQEKIKVIKTLRAESAMLKAQRDEVEEQQEKIEEEIKEMLTEDGQTNFTCEEGTVYLSFISQVSMPKTSESKEQFYNFLKEKGLYDDMVSVNSQKLNGFYRKEKEAAETAGALFFSMPGIESANTVTRIGFRVK